MRHTKPLYFLLLFLLLSNPFFAFSQGTSGENALFESRSIVDLPTAGIAPKKSLTIYSLVRENGSVLFEGSYSPFDDIQLGGGYVLNNLIGTEDVTASIIPLIHTKWRLLNERKYTPAITLGFSTFGRGKFEQTKKEFQTNSPGVYIALSKEWKWSVGSLSTHGGINFSFDPEQVNRNPNYYFGLEQALSSRLSVLLEYNAMLDETRYSSKGLLNTAFRFSIIKGVTLEFQLRDIFKSTSQNNTIPRNIGLDFVLPL